MSEHHDLEICLREVTNFEHHMFIKKKTFLESKKSKTIRYFGADFDCNCPYLNVELSKYMSISGI